METMPKIKKFYGKEYRLQVSYPMAERESKSFVEGHENLMKFHRVKSEVLTTLDGKPMYFIYARSKARDKR